MSSLSQAIVLSNGAGSKHAASNATTSTEGSNDGYANEGNTSPANKKQRTPPPPKRTRPPRHPLAVHYRGKQQQHKGKKATPVDLSKLPEICMQGKLEVWENQEEEEIDLTPREDAADDNDDNTI